MARYFQTLIIVICCFFSLVVIPSKIHEETVNISEQSFTEKKITDVVYKIFTEKKVETGDFFGLGFEVEAIDGDLYVSFDEIRNELEENGVYYFTETYVRVSYQGEEWCVRIN